MTARARKAPTSGTAAIVLAAGQGTRMASDRPKVLHRVAGTPLVGHVLETLGQAKVAPVVVVVGPGMDDVAAVAAPHTCVTQKDRKGTAHAVLQAKAALKGFKGDILVVYGDTPFVSAATYARMAKARMAKAKPAIVVLGFTPQDPGAYGRLVVGKNGLERIVEAKDASPAERAITLCNSGIVLVDAKVLWATLDKVTPNNAKGEYYLTDIVGLARKAGHTCAVVEGEEEELMGINSRAELAEAEVLAQDKMRRKAMEGGATLTDPGSVFFCADTKLGRDVEVGPFVVFGPGVTVEAGVVIKGFCHIEGAHIRKGAVVGPYARLRPGADIGPDAHVGNFVEVKNATLESGAKVNHLSYVGDARVGAKANVGAGTITANYDGFAKHHTDIGAGAYIGSNTVLVAPVKVGDGGMTGAGTVVRQDVPADALALSGGAQDTRKGFAKKYRALKQAAAAKTKDKKKKKG